MLRSFQQKLESAGSRDPEKFSGLLHERHPLIIETLLQNPAFPPEMVVQLIRRKVVNEEHIHGIATHREWRKDYSIKLELILNPVTPRNISLKLMKDMMLRDLAIISRKVTLHPTLREVAVNFLKTRLESMRSGEKVTLARTGPIAFVGHLMEESELRIVKAALRNYRLKEDDVIRYVTPGSRSGECLDAVLNCDRWGRNPRVIKHLSRHPNLSFAARQIVFKELPLPDLVTMTRSPILDKNHQNLAMFILKKRLEELSFADQIRIAGSPSIPLLFTMGSIMQAPAVVRAWLRNTVVTAELCDKVIGENKNEDVKRWIALRRVPDRPEGIDKNEE